MQAQQYDAMGNYTGGSDDTSYQAPAAQTGSAPSYTAYGTGSSVKKSPKKAPSVAYPSSTTTSTTQPIDATVDPAEYSQLDQVAPAASASQIPHDNNTYGDSTGSTNSEPTPDTKDSGAPPGGSTPTTDVVTGSACEAGQARTYDPETRMHTCSGSGQTAADNPCTAAVEDTASICTASNSYAIAQQVAATVSIAGASTANAGAACKMQSTIATTQGLFAGGVSAGCFAKISDCKSSCDPAKAADSLKPAYKTGLAQCSRYTINAAASAAQAASNFVAARLAGDCAKAYTADIPHPNPTLVQSCSGDPTYAATHTLDCYCISNPGDAKCPNPALALTPGGVTGTLSSSGLKVGTGDPNLGAGGLGNSALPTPGPSTAAAAGAAPLPPVGGLDGGGGAPAGAALAAAPEDAGGAGAAAGSGNIFGGFSAGQGGFSYGHAAGSSGGGGVAGAVKSLATKFNLGGLFPKRNDYINRSVAGMSVSAKDGVTGPNGPSIWEKVSRRYQIKKGELLPP